MMTQADRLAKLYGQINDGDELPENIKAEAIRDELGEILPDSALPRLGLSVISKGSVKADLAADMSAGVLAEGKLYYFEVICTASATAHAYAAAITDEKIDADWRIKGQPFTKEWSDIELPESMNIRDTKLSVEGWHGRVLHHVAAYDRTGEIVIVDSDETLWRKLRQRMSCPTLEHWGTTLIPRIKTSGILIPALTFGVAENLSAYILEKEASKTFDALVSEYVRECGGIYAEETKAQLERRSA